MATPTTFIASGTYTQASGAPAPAGSTVTFKAKNRREINNNTIQDAVTITADLNASGILSQVLVKNVGGYDVTENIGKADSIPYVIPGLADIDLSSIDDSAAQFDASDVVNVVPGENVVGTLYTWLLSDGADKVKRFTSASAVTARCDGAALIPVGTVFNGMQAGAGRVTVTGINGAVIQPAGAVTSIAQYSTFQVRKDSPTVFVVSGSVS